MGTERNARDPKDYRIILRQDASEPLVHHVGPISKDALLAASIGPFKDAPVDVYTSCVNHAGGVYFNAKACERHPWVVSVDNKSTVRNRSTRR